MRLRRDGCAVAHQIVMTVDKLFSFSTELFHSIFFSVGNLNLSLFLGLFLTDEHYFLVIRISEGIVMALPL
jgi:hypothetical protein